MDAAIQQIKDLYTQADEDTRKSIKHEINNLQTFFRSDLDLVSLMADGVSALTSTHRWEGS